MMAPYEAMIEPYRFRGPDGARPRHLRPRAVNWKNIGDNYSDGLHIPVAHPGLTRLFGKSYGIEAEEHVDRMWGDMQDRPQRQLVRARLPEPAPRVPHLPAASQRHWLYFKLWPNVAFDIYPDQVDFMQWLPVSADREPDPRDQLRPPDDRREMKAARYLNWRINRRVNAEDTALIARVQAGMASRSFSAGPLSDKEVCLRHFCQRMRAMIPKRGRNSARRPGGAAHELVPLPHPKPSP
jgi:phenylpropionate dioxygenase-like ring-hydroxylating dioxygenase large terminal subunit